MVPQTPTVATAPQLESSFHNALRPDAPPTARMTIPPLPSTVQPVPHTGLVRPLGTTHKLPYRFPSVSLTTAPATNWGTE